MKRRVVEQDNALSTVWWIFAAIVFLLVIAIRIRLLFEVSSTLGIRFLTLHGSSTAPIHFGNRFEFAEYLRDHTDANDTIGVLGSEPQIYFYSGRRSATGYIYTYSLMEAQANALTMQQEMIREIETARPKYLVFVQMASSWLPDPKSEGLIFKWSNEYLQANYKVVGFVNIVSLEQTEYYFDQVPESIMASNNYIMLYARKT